MHTKLLRLLALIGACFVGTTPARAAAIAFSEDPNGVAAITVATVIAGAAIAAGVVMASLSLGNTMDASTLLFRRQMVNMGNYDG